MKHRSTRAIFSEWQRLAFEKKGSLRAPARESIKPRKLGRHLSNLFLLEEDKNAELVFRLAGTQICTLFGRELRTVRFASLWPHSNRPALDELLGNVNGLLVPALSRHDGISLAGRKLAFEMLLAPLRPHENHKASLIGAISPLDDVSWVGAHPLVLANLNTITPLAPDMVLEQEVSNPPARAANASNMVLCETNLPAVRRSPRLRIINGGKV